jgi:hypothetical protein
MSTTDTSAKGRPLKVKFQAKAFALVLSIVSLSWVFEAFRQIKSGANAAHIVLLIVALMATAALLWIQAFWIYLEEKSKGTLKRNIPAFESMETWFKTKKKADNRIDKTGSFIARD